MLIMACNCDTYTCLEVVQQYSNCHTTLTVDITATETTTYSWEYEFNGRWFGGTIDVEEGEKIVFPWVFNESYVHLIKIYDTDNVLLNDACYKLDTSKVAGTYSTPSIESSNYSNITLTEAMLSEDKKTVGNSVIADRDIVFVADGNQLYNFASFTQDGNEFTMTNGNAFYVGQKITLQYE